jgi:hypothetical protein
MTPYSLAFPGGYEGALMVLDYTMNGLFALDIIVNFLSAYVDSDYKLIDDLKVRLIAAVVINFFRGSRRTIFVHGFSLISHQYCR